MLFTAPLRFQPIYQARVWGGRRLETFFGRQLPEPGTPYGESWEVSDRPEAQSVVAGGAENAGLTLHELWMHHRQPVFGADSIKIGSERFPLLMKILDATDDLSIQVHPPGEVAAVLGGEPKTEMWFIAHADPGSRIYVGLRPGVSREAFEEALHTGTVADLVQVIEPKAGDCLFLPSGRLHAIGKGLVIFEIQQNSDTTYRVFDWNRPGLDGKPRPLHLPESLASIDFNDTSPAMQIPEANGTLVRCPQFEIRLARDDTAIGTPGEGMTLAVVRGELQIGAGDLFKAADFAIIPASLDVEARKVVKRAPETEWLEVRIPAP